MKKGHVAMLTVTEENWEEVILGPLPETDTYQEHALHMIEDGADLTPDEQAAYEMWLLKQYGQEIEEDF